MSGSVLLRGARVLDLDGDPDAPPVADVLISGNSIAAVGPRLTAVPGTETVDLTGHVLVPGFVNSHYHSNDLMAKGAFETMPLEQWGLVASMIGQNRSL